jgi:RNA polymerase sigma-70 factor (ECF subfamily)
VSRIEGEIVSDVSVAERTSALHDLQHPLRTIHQQFHATIEPIRPDLFSYCLRLTGSVFDAEDLVQETLTRAFGRLFQYYQPVEPRPYIFRMATNLWIDQYRRAQRLAFEPLTRDDQGVSDDPDLDEEVREALQVIVDLLEPRQRVAVLLKDVFGFSNAEIAEFLETTPGAVKALLHRGRARIERHRQPPHRVGAATTQLAEA